MIEPRIQFDSSACDGFFAIYIQLRDAEVGKTIELDDTVSVDVDADGELIGIEIVRLLPPLPPGSARIRVEGEIRIDEIQGAVERKLGRTFPLEFDEIRRAKDLVPHLV